MKIVYNNCYGGFAISTQGFLWLQKNSPSDSIWNAIDADIDSHGCYIENIEEYRVDKYFIKGIEEKGSKFMSGEHSELEIYTSSTRIVRIEEHDGNERVYEINGDNVYIIE